MLVLLLRSASIHADLNRFQIKQQNDAKLKQDLERKKAQVESAIASQAAHDVRFFSTDIIPA